MGADRKRKEARRLKFGTPVPDSQPEAVPRGDGAKQEDDQQDSDGGGVALEAEAEAKSARFIAFIGNLPFSATEEAIAKHFAKLRPMSIRHRVDKTTGKSKGFAFVEFENYDRMKTCLKLYHHSLFDAEEGQRRINVELTAGGGGGKSRERKAKLRVKNQRLNVQRRNAAPQPPKEREDADAGWPGVHPSRQQFIS